MAWDKTRLAIILVLCSFHWHNCEIFTSTAHLETFIHTKFELMKRLFDYVDHSERKLKDLKRFSGSNSNTQSVNGDREVNVSVAARAVQLLGYYSQARRRQAILDWFSDKQHKQRKLIGYIEEIRNSLPSSEDVTGAATAILRLQQTYKMDARSFIELNSIHSGRPIDLSLEEVYHIGRIAFTEGKVALTKQWMLLALEKSENETQQSDVGRDFPNYYVDIRDHLAYANFKLGLYSESLKYTKEILQWDKNNEDAKFNLAILNRKLESGQFKEYNPESEQEEYYLQQKYEALCRDALNRSNFISRAFESRYRCGFFNKHPLLVLRPVKYEVISLAPEIYLYYEMVSKLEARILKRLAFPYLERANVSESNKLTTTSYRISKSCWLPDNEHQVVEKLSRKIEAITGLNTETSEDLQIANYGIGGHYEPHYDWSQNFERSVMKTFGQGNRIATALLYLNDVTSGGATVFPEAEKTILPASGTMAFWYNLHMNGTGDTKTIHAACPVVIGTKWVATKWFHERGQEFRRPCTRNNMW